MYFFHQSPTALISEYSQNVDYLLKQTMAAGNNRNQHTNKLNLQRDEKEADQMLNLVDEVHPIPQLGSICITNRSSNWL